MSSDLLPLARGGVPMEPAENGDIDGPQRFLGNAQAADPEVIHV